jgi:hypothetical protein
MAEARRLGSVRVRTTLAAVAAVGVAMLIGALVMLAFVERSLTAQVADSAEVRAAELIDSPEPPTGVIGVIDPTEEFIQVIRDGAIVAASSNVRGRPPRASPLRESMCSSMTCRSRTPRSLSPRWRAGT